MDRVFQSKTDLSSYLLLAFALTATVWAMWNKTGLIYAPCIVLVALIVERIIHTQYVISESGKLIIQRGRLARDKSIDLQSIERIDQVCRFRIGGKSYGQYLIIVLSGGQQVAVRPKNETGFVESITKCRRQTTQKAANSNDENCISREIDTDTSDDRDTSATYED